MADVTSSRDFMSWRVAPITDAGRKLVPSERVVDKAEYERLIAAAQERGLTWRPV